jgi:hypothetical protein
LGLYLFPGHDDYTAGDYERFVKIAAVLSSMVTDANLDEAIGPKSPPPPAYEDCQSQPICNVQRDATNSGGDVEVIFQAFLPN